ncbi:MAG: hypothetical protein ACHQAX_04070 [Gammaproteobacteria bacterium]
MPNPRLFIMDPDRRDQARKQRLEKAQDACRRASQRDIHLVEATLNSRGIDTRLTRLRIQHEVAITTRSKDVIESPFNRMTGPLPVQRMREAIKNMDQAIDHAGQTAAEIGEVNCQARDRYVVERLRQLNDITDLTDEQLLELLADLCDYVLLSWEAHDPEVTRIFNYCASKLSELQFQDFLPRLIKVENGHKSTYRFYLMAKTVLFEIWMHIDQLHKDRLKSAFVPFMTPELLQKYGCPLHAAAYDNDAGTFVVLTELGVPLDALSDELPLISTTLGKDAIGKTAFEIAFERVVTSPEHVSVKAFEHYMDYQFRAAERVSQEIVIRRSRALAVVKQRIPMRFLAAGPRFNGFRLVRDGLDVAEDIMLEFGIPLQGQTVVTVMINGLLGPRPAMVREETYGLYQEIRTRVKTSLENCLFSYDAAMNLLNRGEFKAFMYLKWLGHVQSITADDTLIDLYMKPCHATGNTYLHYLVSHWDHLDHVTSRYELQIRLSGIVHVLLICGDRACQVRNKEGKSPWDMCDSEDLRIILRYLGIKIAPEFIASSIEQMRAQVTLEPDLLRQIPTHLTSDPMQLAERIYAMLQEYEEKGSDLTTLEAELIMSMKQYMCQYMTSFMTLDSQHNYQGDLIVMLQQKATLYRTTAAYSMADQLKTLFKEHLLNAIDDLLNDVLERHSVDVIGQQGLLDVVACCQAKLERAKRSSITMQLLSSDSATNLTESSFKELSQSGSASSSHMLLTHAQLRGVVPGPASTGTSHGMSNQL